MASNNDKTQQTAIQSSILQYKDKIYKDLNLSLRITHEETTYSTRIIQWEDDMITFDAPLFQRDFVIFPMPCMLKVALVAQSAIYVTSLTLIGKERGQDSLQYTGQISLPIEKKQQREHFRLPILLPLTYQIISTDTRVQPKDNIGYSATTVNISAGGLCMVSKEKLQKDTSLNLEFEFLDQNLSLKGIVLLDGEQLENKLYSHRIRFNNLSAHTEHQITKLIFEKQRLMLARP